MSDKIFTLRYELVPRYGSQTCGDCCMLKDVHGSPVCTATTAMRDACLRGGVFVELPSEGER